MDPLTLVILIGIGLLLFASQSSAGTAPVGGTTANPAPVGTVVVSSSGGTPTVVTPAPGTFGSISGLVAAVVARIDPATDTTPVEPISASTPQVQPPTMVYTPPSTPQPLPPSLSYADFLSKVQPILLAAYPNLTYEQASELMYQLGVLQEPVNVVVHGLGTVAPSPGKTTGPMTNVVVLAPGQPVPPAAATQTGADAVVGGTYYVTEDPSTPASPPSAKSTKGGGG